MVVIGYKGPVEKVDDLTVQFNLKQPNPRFQLDYFSVRIWGSVNILPEHILKGTTAADVEKIPFTLGTPGTTVGTGPYKLTAFTPDQSVEVTSVPVPPDLRTYRPPRRATACRW